MTEIQELAEELIKQLESHSGIDPETHRKHHEYIDDCIQDNRRKRVFWDNVKKQVTGWGIITVLGGIGFAVWDVVTRVIHKG